MGKDHVLHAEALGQDGYSVRHCGCCHLVADGEHVKVADQSTQAHHQLAKADGQHAVPDQGCNGQTDHGKTATPSLAQQAATLSIQEHEYISVNSLKQFQQIPARLGTTVQDAIVLNKEFGPGPGDPTKIVEKNIHRSPSSPAIARMAWSPTMASTPGVSAGGVIMNPNGMISGPYTGPTGQVGGWVYACA